MGVTTTTVSCIITFYKNGSSYKQGNATGSSASAYPYAVGSIIAYMNGTTDYMELYVQSTVSGSTTWSGAATNNYFQGILIRTA